MIDIVRKVYRLLSPKERKSALLLLMQMIFSSILSVFSIALVLPFMSIILNNSFIFQNKIIFSMYNLMHFKNVHNFLIFFGAFLLVALVVGNISTALSIWSSSHFSLLRNKSFSEKLLRQYLLQPYIFYLERNSSILTKNIMIEVYTVVYNIVLGIMRVVEQSALVLLILLLLLFLNPLLSLVVLSLLGGVYTMIYFFAKGRLSTVSREVISSRDAMTKIVTEGFGAIKYLKCLNQEENVLDNYSKEATVFVKHVAFTHVIGATPRYALEMVSFGGMVVFLLIYLVKNLDVSKIIPLISLYAFAGYRMMPNLHYIFYNVTHIKANKKSLDLIYEDIMNLPVLHKPSASVQESIPFNRELQLRDVAFSYPSAAKNTISDLSLTIQANAKVGFVGSTGAGKTTIVDIILGLLEPQSGLMTVDGKEINGSNIKAWQNNLGYVPQNVYLIDSSIARNIAFGINPDEIDMDMVKLSATKANLNDFVETLPSKYETEIGERGVRLSGGQVQRIGIARALYRNPQVLVLDEATSALDSITEDAVLQALKNVGRERTIIMIAHRLSTIRECDKIFVIDNGCIADSGSYDELFERNSVFRSMTKQKDNVG